MKKNPAVFSLMILSLLVFASVVQAKDSGMEDSEKNEEQNKNEKQEKNEVKFEQKEATEAEKKQFEANKLKNEIKQREQEKKLELEHAKKEEMNIKSLKKEDESKEDGSRMKKDDESKKDDSGMKKDDDSNSERENELEMERERDASGSAKEHMDEVAEKVNKLLQTKEDAKGVGKKVREVAIEQVKSQEKIAEKLAKMEEKKVWLKKIVGYDQEAVQVVAEEIDANRLRIQELIKLQEETVDKNEVSELETAITSLIDQNAALQDTVQEEMQNQGVWGWFRSVFKRS